MDSELKLLLVEDEHNDAALFGIAVQRTGLDIWLQRVSDGQQAIDLLEGKGPYADRSLYPFPDLVLLDLKLPLLDGFEFLAWRFAAPAYASLPVVIFTGTRNNEEVKRALAMGGNTVIVKPTHFDEWLNTVRAIWDLGMKFRAQRPIGK